MRTIKPYDAANGDDDEDYRGSCAGGKGKKRLQLVCFTLLLPFCLHRVTTLLRIGLIDIHDEDNEYNENNENHEDVKKI